MIRLDITVPDITQVLAAGYTIIRVYTDTAENGEFTTLDGTVTLVAGQSGYSYVDLDGTTATWYKTAYYGETPGESTKSDAQQGGTCDAYCTALDVRAELAIGSGQPTIAATHEAVLWDMAVEASRLIDAHHQLTPGAYMAATSEVRYYRGSGRAIQFIDPAVSISEVAVEETDGSYTAWTEDTNYYTWPDNETPILQLRIHSKTGNTKSVWTRGPRRVKVTGVFGQSATPPALIQRACKVQVARWYKRATAGWADAMGSPEMGELRYVKKLDPVVQDILDTARPKGARL